MSITKRLSGVAQIFLTEGSDERKITALVSDKLVTTSRFSNLSIAASGTATITLGATTSPRYVWVKPSGGQVYIGKAVTNITTNALRIPDEGIHFASYTGITKIVLKNKSTTTAVEVNFGVFVASTTTTD